MTAAPGHSVIPPSSSARRVQCTQSTTWEAMYPEDADGPEAAEGTAAHWALSEQLEGRLVDEGQIAPNGVVLTAEMVQAADQTYDYVCRVLKPFGLRPQDGHIEQRVMIPRVHAQSWGTPDYWILLPSSVLFVLDFKFGHRYVEVFENMQLVEYIAGICQDVPFAGEPLTILAVIAQPRSYHRDGPVREWRTTLLDLRALINVANNAAHEALGPTPRTRVGPECRDCRARQACPTLQAASMQAVDESKRSTPLVLPPTAASLELRMIDQAIERLKARRSGLSEQITAQIKSGQFVPGWALEPSTGREQWTRPPSEVIALGQMLGVNVAKAPEALTPNQARDAGMDPGVVAEMSKRGKGAATLVLDDGSFARRIFG